MTAEELQAGTVRYAAFCAATGKVGTEYVKQACTFYGPDQHFRASWTPPAPPPAKSPGETVGPWSGLGTHGANTARSALELLRRDGLWPPPEAAH